MSASQGDSAKPARVKRLGGPGWAHALEALGALAMGAGIWARLSEPLPPGWSLAGWGALAIGALLLLVGSTVIGMDLLGRAQAPLPRREPGERP